MKISRNQSPTFMILVELSECQFELRIPFLVSIQKRRGRFKRFRNSKLYTVRISPRRITGVWNRSAFAYRFRDLMLGEPIVSIYPDTHNLRTVKYYRDVSNVQWRVESGIREVELKYFNTYLFSEGVWIITNELTQQQFSSLMSQDPEEMIRLFNRIQKENP